MSKKLFVFKSAYIRTTYYCCGKQKWNVCLQFMSKVLIIFKVQGILASFIDNSWLKEAFWFTTHWVKSYTQVFIRWDWNVLIVDTDTPLVIFTSMVWNSCRSFPFNWNEIFHNNVSHYMSSDNEKCHILFFWAKAMGSDSNHSAFTQIRKKEVAL